MKIHISSWQQIARKYKISNYELAIMEQAFKI